MIYPHVMLYCRYFREDLYGLAHVTPWQSYDLHDLANTSRVGCVLSYNTDAAQHRTTKDVRGRHFDPLTDGNFPIIHLD